MDTFKLNIVNAVVVVALVAISMCMPVVAASLAHGAKTHVTTTAQPTLNQNSNDNLVR